MRVIVTGSSGFIGYHVCKRLHELKMDVIPVDNHTSVCSVNYEETCKLRVDRKNLLQEMGLNSRYCNFSEILNYVDPTTIDLVIHLAAFPGVRDSFVIPGRYYENNVQETQRFIGSLTRHGIKKVIYASSSSVMSNNKINPWTEEEPVGYTESHYANTKICNENQFRLSEIPVTIGLRFFTVYGPYGRPDMAMFNFVHRLCNGLPITIYNNGHMKRDFTYIDDIVDGIMTTVGLTNAIKSNANEIFNIGRGQPIDLKTFVDVIVDNLRDDIPNIDDLVEFSPDLPKGDVLSTWSDTRKLQRYGYHPDVSVEEGVKKFIDWYKEYYDI
jgi:UDP-glucuronate 4-epimerase